MAQILASDLGLPLDPVKLTGPQFLQIVSDRLKHRANLWRSAVIMTGASIALAIAAIFYVLVKDSFLLVRSHQPIRSPVANWTGEVIPPKGSTSSTYSESRSPLRFDKESGKQVFNFSEPGDYVEMVSDDLPYGSSQRSIVAWVKYRSEVKDFEEQFITGYGELGKFAATYLLSTTSSGTPFFSNWGDGVNALNPVEAHTWHQVVAASRMLEGAVVTALYVDGRYQTEKAVRIETPKSYRLFVGGLPPDVRQKSYPYIDRQLDGEVRDISVYDFTLNAENVKYLYNNHDWK